MVTPWPSDSATQLRNTSRALFRHQPGERHTDDVERDSCSVCALLGWNADKEGIGPNCAGWHRAYVESGRGVPAKWLDDLVNELTEVSPYSECLRRDIATYGLRILPVRED